MVDISDAWVLHVTTTVWIPERAPPAASRRGAMHTKFVGPDDPVRGLTMQGTPPVTTPPKTKVAPTVTIQDAARLVPTKIRLLLPTTPILGEIVVIEAPAGIREFEIVSFQF